MDDHNILSLSARAIDTRYGNAIAAHLPQEEIRGVYALACGRQGVEESKWQPQIVSLRPEIVAIRAVPRDNRIEGSQPLEERRRWIDSGQAHPVNSGCCDRLHAVREPD